MTNFIETTDNQFDVHVLKCDIPVLAHFWATGHSGSAKLELVLGEIATIYGEQIKIVKVNIATNPTMTSVYGVVNLPTLILFKNGLLVARVEGLVDKNELLAKLNL